MKNSFVVKFAVELGFTALRRLLPGMAFMFGGCPGIVFGFFAEKYLGMLLDEGILVIDLTMNSLKIAMEKDEYRELALKAYAKARARVYTDEEKREIRKQYLDVIRKFGTFGNGVRNDTDS